MTKEALERLCRDRELVTPEFHPSSDFYGHAHLLKRYCGRPEQVSLRAAVEHSVFIQDFFWDIDLQARLPVFLCASPQHAREYERRAPGKKAFAIGPMTSYVNPVEPVADSVLDADYLLVCPSHSSHHDVVSFNVEALADRVVELAKGYRSAKVCIYWKDFLEERAKPFTRRGLECVSAGHIYDFDFLPRFSRLLRGAAAVFTNSIGSHVLYATLLGIPTWIEREAFPIGASLADQASGGPAWGTDPNIVRMHELFSQRRDKLTTAQRDFVDQLTGADSYRSARELNEILDEAADAHRRQWTPLQELRDLAQGARFLKGTIQRRLGR